MTVAGAAALRLLDRAVKQAVWTDRDDLFSVQLLAFGAPADD